MDTSSDNPSNLNHRFPLSRSSSNIMPAMMLMIPGRTHSRQNNSTSVAKHTTYPTTNHMASTSFVPCPPYILSHYEIRVSSALECARVLTRHERVQVIRGLSLQ